MNSLIRTITRTGSLIALLCMTAPTFAETTEVQPPAQIAELIYKDSNGNEHHLDATTRRIYASADRAGDALLKEVLGTAGQNALDAHGAIVIADLSEAPRLIRPLIRSSLRDRRYTTLIDERGETRKLLPFREDQLTVVELDRHAVVSVRFIGDAPSLRQSLNIPAAP